MATIDERVAALEAFAKELGYRGIPAPVAEAAPVPSAQADAVAQPVQPAQSSEPAPQA